MEFAISLPVLMLVVFGGIEFSRANVLINTAKMAAAEGARRGIVLGTTASDIEATVDNELSKVGVAHADVVVDPPVVNDDTKVVTVGLSIPLDARNGYVTPRFFLGKNVWKITSIPREAKNDAQMEDLLNAAYNNMKGKLNAKAKAAQKALDNANTNSPLAGN
ncbi:pilus assembly protein [Aeoliella sp. ICT_H6.2]|uniref:Pilus assembly protein n=1 Tax=Aeoliella straminimaris TaxID=2954799 RepID=A0A9X2FCQ2_9BACT|nr:pilus assembly protein [Aeoliella straminimaris]